MFEPLAVAGNPATTVGVENESFVGTAISLAEGKNPSKRMDRSVTAQDFMVDGMVDACFFKF
jgi:hypothetical protein